VKIKGGYNGFPYYFNQMTIEENRDKFYRDAETYLELEEGWLYDNHGNPYGQAFPRSLLETFVKKFIHYYPKDMLLPEYYYPDEDLAIGFDWQVGRVHTTLEINIETYELLFDAYNLETQQGDSLEIILETDSDWKQLMDKVIKWSKPEWNLK